MISVAIATYNGEKYIKKQVESIINQTLTVDEIVICDDRSKDKTAEIVNELIRDNESSVEIHFYRNERNLGYIRNFYQSIKKTKGDYIFLSDQDDLWVHDKVEKMIAKMKELNAEVICSNFDIIDQNDNPSMDIYNVPDFIKKAPEGTSRVMLTRLMLGNIAQGCTYCFTKKVKDIYLSINNKEIIHDHQIMMIGAAMKKTYFMNEKLIKYRIHGNNAIGFSDKKKIRGIDFHMKLREPRMVTFLKSIKKYEKVDHYMICVLMQYFRIPIIRVFVKRFLPI